MLRRTEGYLQMQRDKGLLGVGKVGEILLSRGEMDALL